MVKTLEDIERWPETKAIMNIIDGAILIRANHPDKTLKEMHEQLLILQDYINAQVFLSEEYGCTRCFADPKAVKSIFDKLESEVDRARGFLIERKNDDAV